MNVFLRLFFLLLVPLAFLSTPHQAFAQFRDWGDCAAGGVAQLSCIPIVFQNVVTAALMFAGVVAVIMIVYGGIRYITSRGDPKAVEGARNTLTWAIIGLVVIILSFLIINFISFFTNVPCILEFGFEQCR